MAKIEFEAFVEDWTKNTVEHPSWGMKTAETHRKKKPDSNEYETSGRTFRTVKVSRASGLDLDDFRKGDRVKVWGQEQTETREHEGKKYYDLIVWADRVEPSERGSAATGSTETRQEAPSEEPWAQAPTDGYDAGVPF
ncbi:MAG: hypothetical protein H7288_11640 [Kineosporiaceae bacterium]|nr:hypothetical protein [Aeromicrobium sp.]